MPKRYDNKLYKNEHYYIKLDSRNYKHERIYLHVFIVDWILIIRIINL